MKILLAAFILFVSSDSFSKTMDYKCNLEWKTLSEQRLFKDLSMSGKLTQKITDEMSVVISSSGKINTLTVKEIYKDNKKNFIEYSFSCDPVLNCSGQRINMVDGKKELQKIVSAGTSTYGLGKIESRELFLYKNIVSGFSFDYILYKNEASEAMGLKVSCRGQK